VWDDQEEAAFVARQARRLVESGAVPAGYREIAVMYRTNQQSRVMEEQFVRNGVPYQLIGATKFYERKEVKDLLAYLRVLANPDDSVSLLRIINVPPRRIGKATLDRLLGLAAAWGCSVFQALARLSQGIEYSSSAHASPTAPTTTSTSAAAASLAPSLPQQSSSSSSSSSSSASSSSPCLDTIDLDNLKDAMEALSSALNHMPHTPRAPRTPDTETGGGGGGGGGGGAIGATERAAMQAGLKATALKSLLSFWHVLDTLRQGALLSSPQVLSLSRLLAPVPLSLSSPRPSSY
jgi:hypothetical protein